MLTPHRTQLESSGSLFPPATGHFPCTLTLGLGRCLSTLGSPRALPFWRTTKCVELWGLRACSLQLLYLIVRQMEVDRNLLLTSEIKEPTTQKDSLTWDSTRIAQLRKGRAKTLRLILWLQAHSSVHIPPRDWHTQIFRAFLQLQFQENLKVSSEPFPRELLAFSHFLGGL